MLLINAIMLPSFPRQPQTKPRRWKRLLGDIAKKEDGARLATAAKKEDEVQSTAPPIPAPTASAVPTASEFSGNPGRPGQPQNYVVDIDAPNRHCGVVPDRLSVLQA